MNKINTLLLSILFALCFTACSNVSPKEKQMKELKIFSMNRENDGYFDGFFPSNFYQNFAEGKFNRNIYPEFSDRAAWTKARKNKYADMIIKTADKAIAEGVPQLLFSEYRKFAENGNRTDYQKPYYKRRVNIANLALALCLTGDKDKYMPALMDNTLAVMEEHTWTIPAHSQWDKKQLRARKPSALFCSETGAMLAILHHILGDELDKEYENFSEEIRKKVLERTVYNILLNPDSENMHWWYMIERPSNWTPWCAYNNLISTILLEKDNEKISLFVHEFIKITARFAAHYADNGYCEEGPSYFNKSSLIMFATLQLMQKVQPKSMDKLLAVPRIRAMLEFIAHMSMNPTQMLSFGDAQPEVKISLNLLIPCAVMLNSELLFNYCSGKTATLGALSDRLHIGLGLLFDCPEKLPPATDLKAGFSYFENRLAISRNKNFSAALKVGNNAEYHNHNDMGHFVLYHNDRPVIIDAGSGAYQKINFSNKRYTLWYTRGTGHNAPVFGDFEQIYGDEYTASFISAAPEKTVADLSKAYPAEAKVKYFRRTVENSENAVVLSDDFELEKPLTATVTFMTPAPVQVISKNQLKIGDTILETENITFDSMEKMPLLEVTNQDPSTAIWNGNVTALRFKTDNSKYKFVFKK